MSTLLQIVTRFCEETGQTVPSSVVGNTDLGVLQLKRLLEVVGEHIVQKGDWQRLRRRITWTSVAGEDQGLITSITGISSPGVIIPNTFWDNTLRRPIFGPVSDQNWQALKAFVPSNPLYQFRIENGKILINGDMPVGHTLTFIYQTKAWIETAASSGLYIEAFANDSNVPVFSDQLMTLGLRAFWLRAKQLPFDAEMQMFSSALMDEGTRDKVKPVIDMSDGNRQMIRPGVFVPAGNWNVTP